MEAARPMRRVRAGPAVVAAALAALVASPLAGAHVAAPYVAGGLVYGDCGSGADAGGAFPQATAVMLPAQCSAALASPTGDLEDWYRFPAVKGATILVGLDADAGPDIFEVCVVSPTQALVRCAAMAAVVAGIVHVECDALTLAEKPPDACNDPVVETQADMSGDWRIRVRNGPVTSGVPGTVVGYGLTVDVV